MTIKQPLDYDREFWGNRVAKAGNAMFKLLLGDTTKNLSASDDVYWIIVKRPGKCDDRKGGFSDIKLVEQMLRELYAFYPDCFLTVISAPYWVYPTDGREWISIYGDRRKKMPARFTLLLDRTKYTDKQWKWCNNYQDRTGHEPMMCDFEAGNKSFIEAARFSVDWYEDHSGDAHRSIGYIPGEQNV